MAASGEVGVPTGPHGGERIRDRRRRQLREELSDIAARMFLDRGFDAVRVADIARVAGVTEKTVFNHFPTKEALIVDRWDVMTARVAELMRDGLLSMSAIVLRVLREELEVLLGARDEAERAGDLRDLARFRDLIESTPALRAHELEAMHRLTEVIAETLRSRAVNGRKDDGVADSIRWARATATVGLWHVFYRSLRRHVDVASRDTPREKLGSAVLADLRAAARAVSIDG